MILSPLFLCNGAHEPTGDYFFRPQHLYSLHPTVFAHTSRSPTAALFLFSFPLRLDRPVGISASNREENRREEDLHSYPEQRCWKLGLLFWIIQPDSWNTVHWPINITIVWWHFIETSIMVALFVVSCLSFTPTYRLALILIGKGASRRA